MTGKMSSIQSSNSNDLGQQLKSLKVQSDAQPAKGRALQSLLNQSFQPATPDQPQLDHALLHTVSTPSNYSSGSGQHSSADASTEEGTRPQLVTQSADQSNAQPDSGTSGLSAQLSDNKAQGPTPDIQGQVEQAQLELSSSAKALPEHDALVAIAAENRAAQLPEGEPLEIHNKQEAEDYKENTGECPPGWVCPPGVSPFAVAPAPPMSRAGSEALPPLAPHSGQKRHRMKAQDSIPHSPSRLRTQGRAMSMQGSARLQATASRSVSQMLATFPGLETSTPFHNMLKKSLSRSLSSWLQAHPGLDNSSAGSAQHSRLSGPQHAQRAPSQAMSAALSAQLYPGLEQAISNWAQQAQHDSPMVQSRSTSRALSGMSDMPGLEQAISNWAQHSQHDRASKLQSTGPASRAASGMSDMPGLEQAISNWAEHAQHDEAQNAQHPDSRAGVPASLYAGLEQAISNWAQQAQHERSSAQQSQPMSRAASEAMYPGLERAISNWAQHAQQVVPHAMQTATPATRAMSTVSEAWYPGLERAISNWAEQAQHVVLDALQPSSNHSTPPASSLPESEFKRAVSDWAQQAQHDMVSLLKSQAAAPSRAGTEALSEAMYPGLERAVSDWAQHARCLQHDNSQIAPSDDASSRASSLALDDMYPGLEQAICDWAQETHAHDVAPLQLAQAVSSCLDHAFEQMDHEDEAEPINGDHQPAEDKQNLQQLQLAATILAVSRAGSLYPGLETTQNPPVPSQHTQDSSSPVNPASLASALEAASASDKAAVDKSLAPEAAATSADESGAPAQAAAAMQRLSVESGAGATQSHGDHSAPESTHQASHLSHELVPETAVNSPRAAPGSPKSFSHAGARQANKAGHADSMLKAHSRELGQRQQLMHAKLHQAHPTTKAADLAHGNAFMHLTAEPATAASDAKPPLSGRKAHDHPKASHDVLTPPTTANEVA